MKNSVSGADSGTEKRFLNNLTEWKDVWGLNYLINTICLGIFSSAGGRKKYFGLNQFWILASVISVFLFLVEGS